MVTSIVTDTLVIVTKVLVKTLEDLEKRVGVETIQTIVEISQNTMKSPGDLMRFLVTQDPVEKPSSNACGKNFQMSKK